MRAASIIIWSFLFFTTSRNETPCEEEKWCSLLETYYKTFSGPPFQSNPENYNVANLDDWDNGQQRKNDGEELKITSQNFDQFFKKMENRISTKENDSVCNMTNPSKKQIDELNMILFLTLKFGIDTICYNNESRLVLQGNFLTTSRIDAKIKASGCDEQIRVLEFYATDTIIFDSNLYYPNKSMVIVAPILWVAQKSQIDIHGADSSARKPSENKKSKDGIAGEPGTSGGSFLGIGAIFKNMDQLEIIANGGKGGPGGDGRHGAKGDDAKEIKGRTSNMKKRKGVYYYKGNYGKKGADGGRGGQGGQGGYAGQITIMQLGNSFYNPPKIIATDGVKGEPGKPGQGGIGGRNSESLYCITFDFTGEGYCVSHKDFDRGLDPIRNSTKEMDMNTRSEWLRFKTLEKKFPRYPDGKVRAENGTSPSPENTTGDTKQPTPAFNLSIIGGDVLRTFNCLMRKSLIIGDYTHKRNYDFLSQLYRNTTLMNNYNTMQLVQEFIDLESDYYFLFDKVDLLPIYDGFQEHLTKRLQSKQTMSQATDEEVVLVHLIIALQSKICNLQDAAKTSIITDMKSFLSGFMENVRLLKENDAYQVIMSTGEQYSKEMDGQVKQAQDKINKFILPEIKYATKMAEYYAKGIITEMLHKLKGLKDEKERMKKQRSELENAQGLSVLSGIFKFIGGIASMFPKIGTIIEAGCNIMSSVTDAATKAKTSYQRIGGENGELTSDAQKSSENMAKLQDKSDEVLNEVEELFRSHDIVTRSDDTDEDEKQYKQIGKIFGGVNTAVKAISDTASEVKDIGQKIKQVDEDLKKNAEAQKALEETMAIAKDKLKPILGTFKKIIESVITNASGKDFATLTIAQKKVDKFVAELMKVLQGLANHFPSGGKMMKAINDVTGAVKLIMEINKHNLVFIENKRMGHFMTDLQSARYQNVAVKDPKYKKALAKLRSCLYTNIILTDYKQSSEQLKQYVFPLARAFMGKMNLKSFLRRIHNNTENILEFAINEIGLYKTQLSRSNMFVMFFDDVKYRARFDPTTPTKSFFVWRIKDHPKQIGELLSGKEVFFRATPYIIHSDKNAVKFNKIGIMLKIRSLVANYYEPKVRAILKDFKVIMVHTGENFYICDNTTYVINSQKVTFQYSFLNYYKEKSYREKPFLRNTVYDKMFGGDYQLSPFTLWKFQLVNISINGKYEDLKYYLRRRRIEVHLVGDGEYYAADSRACGSNLNEYYKPFNLHEPKQKKPCVYGESYIKDENEIAQI